MFELVLLGIAGFIFFISPQKAVFAITLFISLWLEWSFPGLFGIRIGLVDVAVVGGLLGIIISSSEKDGDKKIPLKGFIFVYMIISVLSVMLSPFSRFDHFGKFIWVPYKEIYVTLLFFLFYFLLNNKSIIQKTVNLVLLSSLVCSLLGIIQGITQSQVGFKIGTYSLSRVFGEDTENFLRAFGTFGHANEFGGFLIWPLAISIAIFLGDKTFKYRRFLPYLLAIQGLALIMTFSRGAWAGMFLSFAIIAYYTKLYKKVAFVGILLTLVVFMFSLKAIAPELDIIPGNVLGRFVSVGNVREDVAMKPRYTRWAYFYAMSLDRPLTGFGFTNPTEVRIHFNEEAPTPHNTYLSIAVKRGYIALGIMILIIYSFAKFAFRNYKSSEDVFFKVLGLGTFAGLAGLFGVAALLGSFLEARQINILFWFLLAVTLRINNMILINTRT